MSRPHGILFIIELELEHCVGAGKDVRSYFNNQCQGLSSGGDDNP